MPGMSLQERIDAAGERAAAAAEKVKQLKERQRMIEMKLEKAKRKADRSAETRRKILLGAWAMRFMDGNPKSRENVMAGLDKFLSREDDRALFGLPPLPASPPEA